MSYWFNGLLTVESVKNVLDSIDKSEALALLLKKEVTTAKSKRYLDIADAIIEHLGRGIKRVTKTASDDAKSSDDEHVTEEFDPKLDEKIEKRQTLQLKKKQRSKKIEAEEADLDKAHLLEIVSEVQNNDLLKALPKTVYDKALEK
ncbi:hypothetical protein HKX48_003038, partial [Thoreauomyces humboldtii]